jgi:4a-hydroxytetrahydrobiopterin dehydratase
VSMRLSKNKCTPCQGGIPPMTKHEAEQHLVNLAHWTLEDDASKLKRKFEFKNFVDALSFTNKVGELCEAEGHHADIKLGWGYVHVYFQTHKINGLHLNDFIMAAKVNDLSKH